MLSIGLSLTVRQRKHKTWFLPGLFGKTIFIKRTQLENEVIYIYIFSTELCSADEGKGSKANGNRKSKKV